MISIDKCLLIHHSLLFIHLAHFLFFSCSSYLNERIFFLHMIFIFKSFIALMSTNKNIWSQSEDVHFYVFFCDEDCPYYPKIPVLSVGNFWSYQKYIYVQYFHAFLSFPKESEFIISLVLHFGSFKLFRVLKESQRTKHFSRLKYEKLKTFILWYTSFVIFLMIHLRSVSKNKQKT